MLSPSNDRPARYRKYLVYDFEWVPGTLEIRLCGVYDGDRYRAYRTVREFCSAELTATNNGKWFYAHFGGGADFQFVLQELVKQGSTYRVRGSFSGSSAIIVDVYRGRYRWTFCDSYWLLRDSLASIGKWIGVEKGEGYDVNREWYATARLIDLLIYNERDCVILFKAIKAFEQTLIDMGGVLKKTIAGCAMELFKRKYLDSIIHTNKAVNEIARDAYFASRVEVFEKSCGEALYYDVNSSFPYAMTFPAPGSLIATRHGLPDRLMHEPNSTPFLVLADIEIRDTYLPCLPYRQSGRVFFPVGRWVSWFTGPDFELLIKSGGIVHTVFESLEFEPFYGFSAYASDLFEMRRKTEGFERLVIKYLLNSLYGKLGESPDNKQTLHLNPDEKTLARLDRSLDMLMPGLWIETASRYVPHEHVPAAAHITAIARRTLYRFLEKSSRTYYCDTDGFATETEYDTGDGLGELKLEKVVTEGRFIAPKLYDLKTTKGEHIIKGKGFSLKGDADKYEKVISHQDIEIEKMYRLRENLRMGHCIPTESTMNKTYTGNLIEKRFFYPDGRSRPWSVDELLSAL